MVADSAAIEAVRARLAGHLQAGGMGFHDSLKVDIQVVVVDGPKDTLSSVMEVVLPNSGAKLSMIQSASSSSSISSSMASSPSETETDAGKISLDEKDHQQQQQQQQPQVFLLLNRNGRVIQRLASKVYPDETMAGMARLFVSTAMPQVLRALSSVEKMISGITQETTKLQEDAATPFQQLCGGEEEADPKPTYDASLAQGTPFQQLCGGEESERASSPRRIRLAASDATPFQQLCGGEDEAQQQALQQKFVDSTPFQQLCGGEEEAQKRAISTFADSTPFQQLCGGEEGAQKRAITTFADSTPFQQLCGGEEEAQSRAIATFTDSTPFQQLCGGEEDAEHRASFAGSTHFQQLCGGQAEQKSPQQQGLRTSDSTPFQQLCGGEEAAEGNATFASAVPVSASGVRIAESINSAASTARKLFVPPVDDPRHDPHERREAAFWAELDDFETENWKQPRTDHVLGTGLIAYSPLFVQYVRDAAVEIGFRPLPPTTMTRSAHYLRVLSAFFHVPLIDRTRTLLDDAKAHVLDSVPSFDPTFATRNQAETSASPAKHSGNTLSPLCDATAARIWERAEAEDAKIQVMWSGGIDSTGALVALLRTGNPERIAKRLRVLYSDNSVEEYPLFFQEHVATLPSGTIRKIDKNSQIADHIERDSTLTVTGECGDQLFGSQLMELFFCHDEDAAPWAKPFSSLGLAAPWQETILPALVDRELLMQEDLKDFCRWLAPQLEACPLPKPGIVSTFDFLWWCNYSMKWQHVTTRMLNRRDTLTRSDYEQVIHFYSGEDFQQWSFHHHHTGEKLPNLSMWSTYKEPLKRYIRDFTSDDEYYQHKLKLGSLQHKPGMNFAIDSNFNMIRFGGASLDVKKLSSQYGTQLLSFLTDRNTKRQ